MTLRQTVKRVKQRSGDHDWGRTCSPGLPLLVYFQSVVPRREGWIKPGDGSLSPVVGEEGKEGETQSHKDERTRRKLLLQAQPLFKSKSRPKDHEFVFVCIYLKPSFKIYNILT